MEKEGEEKLAVHKIPWHNVEAKEAIKKLNSRPDGLTAQEAKYRLEKDGPNEFKKGKKESKLLLLIKQFNSPLVYILFIAMGISFYTDHLVDAYVIGAVLLFNAAIGFVQEVKAERAIDALKRIIVSYAKVYRDGELVKVPSKHLVRGDVIMIEEGDKIPADARLLDVKNFRTAEASLTGESLPENKHTRALPVDTALGDTTNMVFMSTSAVAGTAKALVVNTGNYSEIGKIASSIQEVEKSESYFKQKTSHLAKVMGIFAIFGSILIFLIGYFINQLTFAEIFFFTIASLVSGIPSGLPAILSIVLAIGALRMARRNAVIRHLPSVETLGIATVIATDKTGTLTKNTITIEKILTSQGAYTVTGDGWQPLGRFLQNKKYVNPRSITTLNKTCIISAICNASNVMRKEGDFEIVGDPTEASLLVLAKKAGIEKGELLKGQMELIDDLPFNSMLKLRASLVQEEKRRKMLYVAGAFEKILESSSKILEESTSKSLSQKDKQKLIKKAEDYAAKGYRVLAVAEKRMPLMSNEARAEDVRELTLVGIVAMKDPPRIEVKDAMKKAHQAGIRIIMNTGDHKTTAIAIAKDVGLIAQNATDGEFPLALTQSELETMNAEEFAKAIRHVNIFARVTPEMKLKIVEALQKQGHVVAMTGDGVNDAPALKKADLGIAMGMIGTDVARESSEMVLTDDNFESIVNAVEEGRIVFRNIRNSSTYLVSTNVAEHLTLISALLLKYPLPLLPIHILWMNLITDGFNGISLAFEHTHSTALNKPPRKKNERILNWEAVPFLAIVGIVMGISTIFFFSYFYEQAGIGKAMTAAFLTMSLCQLVNVFNMRSMHKSLFAIGPFSNKYVIGGVVISIVFLSALLYIPFFQEVFQFQALALMEVGMIVAASLLVLVAGEVYKYVRFTRHAKPSESKQEKQ